MEKKHTNANKLELYAHNSTCDSLFMMKKLMNLQILEKDSRCVLMKGVYMSSNKQFVELLVKDSSEIPGACGFKDEAQQEVMYYDMYNYNTMDSITKMKKTELLKYIPEDDKHSQSTPEELKDKKHTFFQNLEEWNCINKDKHMIL